MDSLQSAVDRLEACTTRLERLQVCERKSFQSLSNSLYLIYVYNLYSKGSSCSLKGDSLCTPVLLSSRQPQPAGLLHQASLQKHQHQDQLQVKEPAMLLMPQQC